MKQEFYDLIINHFKHEYHTELTHIRTQAKALQQNPNAQLSVEFSKYVIDFLKKTGLSQ